MSPPMPREIGSALNIDLLKAFAPMKPELAAIDGLWTVMSPDSIRSVFGREDNKVGLPKN